MRLHHVGFVVASIDQSIPGVERGLGLRWQGVVFDERHLQRMKRFPFG